MSDFNDLSIRVWKGVSFYNDLTRKWLYGDLEVTIDHIQFTPENNEFNVMTKFLEVKSVRKTFTYTLYSCLVFNLVSGKQLWFSSLPNVHDMLNIIEYFHNQNRFLSRKKSVAGEVVKKPETRSVMGQKLLSVTVDSYATLTKASEKLVHQGTQLDSALNDMADIHNDLEIADKITSGLETWLGKWTLPKELQFVKSELVRLEDIPEMCDYEILYTKLVCNNSSSQMLGILRISVEGVLIMTMKQKIVQMYKWKDISRVKVISPCEVVITRYRIGEEDLSYDVICAQLLSFIKLVDNKLKNSVEYVTSGFLASNPAPTKGGTSKPDSIKRSKEELLRSPHSRQSQDRHSDRNSGVSFLHNPNDVKDIQGQISESRQVVTESEMDELNMTLQDMKSLMLGVSERLDSDSQKIDKLTMEVDSANIKLNANQKRIQRLT